MKNLYEVWPTKKALDQMQIKMLLGFIFNVQIFDKESEVVRFEDHYKITTILELMDMKAFTDFIKVKQINIPIIKDLVK